MIIKKTHRRARPDARRRAASSPRCLPRCREEIQPGVRTKDIDAIVERSSGRRVHPVVQGLPRIPGVGLHLAERGDRPRHPRRPGSSRTATSSRSTSERSTRAITPTRPGRSTSAKRPPHEIQRLMRATEESLWAGIAQARAGNRIGDISHAVQQVAEGAGFSVVREYVGHGVGAQLHEDLQIPNYGPAGRGPVLEEGMTIALEPMVNVGRLADRGAVRRLDGRDRRPHALGALRTHDRRDGRRARGPHGASGPSDQRRMSWPCAILVDSRPFGRGPSLPEVFRAQTRE